jgi:ABC-2 type transport system permease protein
VTGTLSTVRVVAAREMLARLRDKGFLISTAVLLAVIAASVALPALLFDPGPPSYAVAATTGQDAALLRAAASGPAGGAAAGPAGGAASGLDVRVELVPDAATARRLLEAGTVDAALLPAGPGGGVRLLGTDGVPGDLADALQQELDARALETGLRELGADDEQVRSLLTPPDVQTQLLSPPDSQAAVALALSLGFAVVFFFTVFIFGMAIAQSVVEEKQSRVVELLVAAVPVRVLLVGKLAGNTALALGQLLLLLAVAAAGASFAGQGELLRLLGRASGWFVLFFLLGFGMLACLWAVTGSLARRQEDLQATTIPLQILVTAPFLAAVYVTEPGPALTTLSYLPFTAPLVMPRRVLLGDASVLEAAAAAGVVVAFGAALVLLAARIYEGSLLRTGGRTTLRGAWAAARS